MGSVMYSLFPKFFQSYSTDKLAETAADCGLDAVDLVVRDGYWVTSAGLESEAPAFVQAMLRGGIKVEFATTGYSPEQLAADDTPLRVMADIGIKGFRMSYFSYNDKENLFAQMDKSRALMHQMAELCGKFGLKAVYQVHHGDRMLIHNAISALYVVRELPPEHVGIMLDPGNQFHEGTDNWKRAVGTLGPYAAAIGVKDGVYRHDADAQQSPGKGWSKGWSPSQSGVTNWHVIGKALHEASFQGVFNFQPFYHSDRPDLLVPTLKEEVAYIRHVMRQTGGSDETV